MERLLQCFKKWRYSGMIDVDKTIQVLQSLSMPTHNSITDKFGFYRYWGENEWNPNTGYSPIHAGVDYSAIPNTDIYNLCTGYAYGHIVGGVVGSVTYIRPIVQQETLDTIMITLMHCEPMEPIWKKCNKTELLTKQAGYGIGAPHLHVEIDVTEDILKELLQRKIISSKKVTDTDIIKKAEQSNIDPNQTIEKVHAQQKRWGIKEIGYDYIIRYALPQYRHSKYSRVGKESTVMLNPLKFI